MKKLQINLSSKKEILTREQLKKIVGGDLGSGSGSCSNHLEACYGRQNCCSGYYCDPTYHKCYM